MASIRFGVNGWSARFDDGFDESAVVRVAGALAKTWATQYEGRTVLIGYDTRHDSKRLAVVAGQVVSASGMRAVVSDRTCPTPALSWSAAQEPHCAGAIMLTASRKPHEYGGIIARQADGGPISKLFATAVDQALGSGTTSNREPIEYADFVTPYIDAVAAFANADLITRAGASVVLDPMYGAGCGCARELFERLGCKVHEIHGRAVGDFRGLHPDVGEPWVDECERTVVSCGADLGIVLDGDCDRVGIIDETGRLVSAHDVAPLVLDNLVNQRGHTGRVVATAAASARIARQADRLGCDYTMVPLGTESLYREFFDGDVILATDESGRICVPSFSYQNDGLLASVLMLELVAASKGGIGQLVRRCEAEIGDMEYVASKINLDFGATQRLRNLLPGINPPDVLGEVPTGISHANGLRVELPDGSWLLLAPSSTGARCAAEAPSASRARALLSWAAELARG